MTEAEYQIQLEEQEQQELEEREFRREAFQTWLEDCPERVYVVEHDDQPSNWWWSRVYVKSDISLEGEEDK